MVDNSKNRFMIYFNEVDNHFNNVETLNARIIIISISKKVIYILLI